VLIMEPSDSLHDFRRSFYECLRRRGDALFELTDAILSTDAAAPSPVHLSLRPTHRRGWGSFYAALTRGRIDAEVLRDLLICHPLAGSGENSCLRGGHERLAPLRGGVQP
jgi:hypothetical protein